MRNQEILTPSYEEACKTLKHIIDVDFPTKEDITHVFLQQEVLKYMVIWGNDSQEVKSALSVVLREVTKNEQSTTKVAPKDNTDHNRKNYIIYPNIEKTYYNKAKTIENILPIQEEVIIEPKVETTIQIQEKKPDLENIIQPIIKKEKITINPDSKIWEENIRIIKGIEFTDEDRKTALNIINNIIKKHLSREFYIKFLTNYTKINSQSINLIIEKYQSLEQYIEFLADKDNNIEQDFIIYRIQTIRMDIANKDHKKTIIQKIIIEIEKILNIE